MKTEDDKRKADTRGELLARILDAAARKKKRKDELRWTQSNNTRSSHTSCKSVLRLMVGFWNVYCGM